MMNQEPEAALQAYVKAFETLEPDAVVPIYHLPCMFIAPHGAFLVTDGGAARAIVSQLMAQARSQGYRRTETRGLEARRLAPTLAMLTGVFVRFNSAGEEIARFGFAYTMLGGEDAWKIAVAVAHEVPATKA